MTVGLCGTKNSQKTSLKSGLKSTAAALLFRVCILVDVAESGQWYTDAELNQPAKFGSIVVILYFCYHVHQSI